jgi:hypothetical protein
LEMNDADLLELIEKEISGGLTGEERQRLQAYLEKDPKARDLHRHMIETGDVLKRVVDVAVPAGLKQSIMASIDTRRYALDGRARAGAPMWGRILSPRLRLVYAFAAGALVGLVVYSQIATESPGRSAIDARHLYGTIARQEVGAFREVDAVSVDLPEVKGEIRLMQAADLVVLEQDLRSEGPLEIRLTFDPAVFRFEGFGSADTLDARVISGEGRLRVAGTGKANYVMSVLRPGGLPALLRLEATVSGGAAYHAQFTVTVED